MGCANCAGLKEKPITGKNRPAQARRSNTKLEAYRGKTQQGVAELKRLYTIDNKKGLLGSGQFGRVFMAHHTADENSKVAIKVLDKHQLEDMLDMLMEEIEIIQRLDHPNVVNYFETYDDAKYLYLVMEYVKGVELL